MGCTIPMPPASLAAATSSALLQGYIAPQIMGYLMPKARVNSVPASMPSLDPKRSALSTDVDPLACGWALPGQLGGRRAAEHLGFVFDDAWIDLDHARIARADDPGEVERLGLVAEDDRLDMQVVERAFHFGDFLLV